MKFVVVCICSLFITTLLGAQSIAPWLMLDGGLGVLLHAPGGSFTPITGIPSPENLTFNVTDGSLRPYFQLGAAIPVQESFSLGARLSYSSFQTTATAQEVVPIASPTGGVLQATLEHRLVYSASMLSLEPLIRFHAFQMFSAELSLPIGYVLQSPYTQEMYFTNPAGLQFVDGEVDQITARGATIPDAAVATVSLALRAEAQVPINASKSLFLVPSLGIQQQINGVSVAGGASTFFNAGIGLRFSLFDVPTPPDPDTVKLPEPIATQPALQIVSLFRSDTVVVFSKEITQQQTVLSTTNQDTVRRNDTLLVTTVQRYTTMVPKLPSILSASVRVAILGEDGNIQKDSKLKTIRVKQTRTVPFMPVVVFDENRSEIPTRYKQLKKSIAGSFKERNVLSDSTTHWQYQVLNIVGGRLVSSPSSTCVLMAFDDGTDNGVRIVADRVKNVREYLTDVFGIAPKRLITDLRKGQASQQPWVFLVDSTRTLLKPIVGTDTIIETRLPKVRIIPDVVSEAGITRWNITCSQQSNSLAQFSGENEVPKFVDWDLMNAVKVNAGSTSPVLVEFSVTDADGSSARTEPARIRMQETAKPDATVAAQQTVVLRVLAPDFLVTPDGELFSGDRKFNSIDFYPASEYDEPEYLLSDAPVTKRTPNASVWFRNNLMYPELDFYRLAEVYTANK